MLNSGGIIQRREGTSRRKPVKSFGVLNTGTPTGGKKKSPLGAEASVGGPPKTNAIYFRRSTDYKRDAGWIGSVHEEIEKKKEKT